MSIYGVTGLPIYYTINLPYVYLQYTDPFFLSHQTYREVRDLQKGAMNLP